MALFDTIRAGSSGATEFEVERSLRFNSGDSTDLQRTPSSAGNRKVWTWSSWIKRSSLSSDYRQIFRAGATMVRFKNDHTLMFERSGGSVSTDGFFRDVTAWYHIVFALDTTQSTESNRIKLYVNSEQQTLSGTFPAQNTDYDINNNVNHFIGQNTANSEFFDGYMAEINFIDGQALTPASFGKTDAVTGQWNPIDTSGLTFGTNGFRLKFDDNSGTSATTLGKDSSGNGNNYTPNNFGTGDAVKDTPSNNFCTLSAIYDSGAAFGSSSLSEAALRYTGGSSNRSIGSTFGIRHTDTQGYYFEARIISGNQANRLFVGIGYTSTNWISTDARGANDDSWVLRNGDGVFIHNSSVDGETTGAGALSIGDVIQIAVKGSKIWVGKNGSYFFSGNPSGDSTPKFSDIASTWTPVADVMTSNVVQFNFGQDSSFSNSVTAQGNTDANGHGDFHHSPPTGFLALCSKNLPDPTIKLPNKYFDTLLYTGNGGTNNITGLSFEPDWVWIKNRSATGDHILCDQIRGLNNLRSNTTTAEQSNGSIHLQSFNSDGITVAGTGSNSNSNGDNFVAWNWYGGGSTVANNDGTISTSVRASTTAGFSIVSWTSDGQGSPTSFGHGLGVKPDFIFIKSRDSSQNWQNWSSTFTNATNNFLVLNLTNGTQTAGAAMWGTIDSSVVNFRHSANSSNGDDMIGYFFSEVASFSKFGSYTGNGNSEGTFVFTGFRPAWVMIKNTVSGHNWQIYDSTRSTINPALVTLYANRDLDEEDNTSVTPFDILSNGFKIRSTWNDTNQSGSTFIYLAFAESPFKNARAR